VRVEREDPEPAERFKDEVGQEDWISPFDDELDLPTFLRRGKSSKEEEEDRDEPAFLRRSAD